MGRLGVFCVVTVVICVAVARTDINLELEPKVNLTDANESYDYRWTKVAVESVQEHGLSSLCKAAYSECDLPETIYTWTSYSVDPNSYNSSTDKVNTALGLAFPPTNTSPPAIILAFGTGPESLTETPISLFKKLLLNQEGLGVFDDTVVGIYARFINEYPHSLTPNTFLNTSSCSPRRVKGKGTDGFSCEFTVGESVITITFVTSEHAGFLKYGKMPVSPHSLEMLIEAEHFKFYPDNNQLAISLSIFSRKNRGGVRNFCSYFVNKEQKEVAYASFFEKFTIDGKRMELEDITYHNYGPGTKMLGNNTGFASVEVMFPENVRSFVYSVAIGVGRDIFSAGASTTALSLLVLIASSFMFLFSAC